MQHTHYFFSSLFIFLLSCNNKSATKMKLVAVDNPDVQTINLVESEVLDNARDHILEIEFIPLEGESVEGLVATIDKVIDFEDRFYVFDKKFSSLKVFDRKGKFLHLIGSLGKGPGEFTSLMDFTIDKENRKIYLLSNSNQAVFEYDTDGKFINKINNNIYSYWFAKHGDHFFYHVNFNGNNISENYNLVVLDRQFQDIQRFFPYNKNEFSISLGYTGFIRENLDGIMYNEPLSDTVFQINNSVEIFPKYIVDFGDKSIPEKVKKSYTEFNKTQFQYGILLPQFQESKNYVAIAYRLGHNMNISYMKKNNKSKNLRPVNFSTYPLNAIVPHGVSEDDTFIGSITPEYKTWIEAGSMPEDILKKNFPEMIKLIPSIKLVDNPILVLYKLKL